MSRELSHQKGRDFQNAVMRWLCGTRLWRLQPRVYGDAYGITKDATCVADSYFDFSLTLNENGVSRKLFYAECKYRDEKFGNINSHFEQYIKKVCRTIKKLSNDEKRHVIIAFISNIPPDKWRNFINDKTKYAEKECGVSISEFDSSSIAFLEQNVFVLYCHMGMVE